MPVMYRPLSLLTPDLSLTLSLLCYRGRGVLFPMLISDLIDVLTLGLSVIA